MRKDLPPGSNLRSMNLIASSAPWSLLTLDNATAQSRADQPIVIMQIVQENNATTSSATARKANAELLAKIAHDASLVLYWPAMLPAGKDVLTMTGCNLH